MTPDQFKLLHSDLQSIASAIQVVGLAIALIGMALTVGLITMNLTLSRSRP